MISFQTTFRRLTSVVALLILLAALVPVARSGAAQDAPPALALSTDAAQPGDMVIARGDGFPARTTVDLVLMPGGTALAIAETRGNGGFRERFAVPVVAPGEYTVVATSGDQTAQAPLLIVGAPAPPLTATPELAATATLAPAATATSVPPSATATSAPVSGPGEVFVGAGDIASSGSSDDRTAALLDGIPGTVFTLGDNAYENGSASDYANYYAPTWGRHQARTRPVPGNHDYQIGGAAGYFGYFGATAGDPATGYYSYDLGSWHVVALNSNLGMAAGSAQEQWLRADLAAHPRGCTLAYWHHARFSSGATHGSDPRSQGVWQALVEAGAEVVLTGHDHDYERFAPLDATGNRDDALGIREFVVGTGGRSHYSFGAVLLASEVRNADTYGVLKLTLRDGGYDWAFVPVAGGSFTDAGSGTCH
jgi:hypothetical protein